ncbi:ras-like protein rasV, partial [Drosophila navojoa]|uniref:ras-like protein rasV n=1 Tax=Drosophila navojoa TaxID=7232 RepID=UPI0011BED236
MRGRHLRRRFSLQPSFMKDDSAEDKPKRDKVGRNNAVDDAIGPANARHKIVVMGAAKVGKTSIITQFLYNTFTTKYKRTIEEMHQGNFSIAGVSLTLDILDTAGSYEVRILLYFFYIYSIYVMYAVSSPLLSCL